jgi:hypothetical protein
VVPLYLASIILTGRRFRSAAGCDSHCPALFVPADGDSSGLREAFGSEVGRNTAIGDHLDDRGVKEREAQDAG